MRHYPILTGDYRIRCEKVILPPAKSEAQRTLCLFLDETSRFPPALPAFAKASAGQSRVNITQDVM